MPSEYSNIYIFNKWSALWFAPLVIYFDFESFLRPVSACSLRGNVSSSSTIEIHELCGFALTVVQHNKPKPKYTHIDSSKNCMAFFVKVLHKLSNDIHKQKQKHPDFLGTRSKIGKTEIVACLICENDFDENDEKDFDHCHYSGEFLGWAHPQCNRLRRTSKFIPVIGHTYKITIPTYLCGFAGMWSIYNNKRNTSNWREINLDAMRCSSGHD